MNFVCLIRDCPKNAAADNVFEICMAARRWAYRDLLEDFLNLSAFTFELMRVADPRTLQGCGDPRTLFLKRVRVSYNLKFRKLQNTTRVLEMDEKALWGKIPQGKLTVLI